MESSKRENPTHMTLASEQSSGFGCSTNWICKNLACGAILSKQDAYCRRCSCCICHNFDDNKDPSLWLVCESDSAQGDSCGLSCHIECAFRQKKLGVVNIGQYMHLDGYYCCFSCGKVSGILRCLINQLGIAKDARRVDVLFYRISLSHRLLEGSDKFKDLHGIITEAKTKMEAEVGPVNGDSVKMDRSIVSRLAGGVDVQKLCADAFNKANGLISNVSPVSSNGYVVSLPAACKFLFEEVTSSSIEFILIDIQTPMNDSIIGYKLWYSKSQESYTKEPVSILTKKHRKILVWHLQPCTEYTFRIISYTEAGDLGHSEAKCFTKSVELFNKKSIPAGLKKKSIVLEDQPNSPNPGGSCSGFTIRDIGKILLKAQARKQGCLEGVCSAVNGCTLKCAAGPDAAGASNGVEKNVLEVVRSNGRVPSDGSQAQPPIQKRDVPFVNFVAETSKKRASNGFDSLDSSFEHCVRVMVRLEEEGYIKKEFRLKFLKWFYKRSTEQERRLINIWIEILNPRSLLEQLIDTYGDMFTSNAQE